jgi:SHS2 domain-containing protein
MRVAAPDLAALFLDALRGLMAVLGPRVEGGAPVRHRISVHSADLTALLVDFLNEALALALTEREGYDEVTFFALDESGAALEAELTGRSAASFEDDVKAVTYHEANLVRSAGGWRTLIVFDI